MIVSDLTSILDVLRNASSFAITTHTNPDGDAIGSVLVMRHLLRALGKERIVCINDDPVPHIYQWLPGADSFQQSHEITTPLDVEVVVIVDAGRLERLGAAATVFPSSAKYIVLDHHIEENPDGDLAYIDKTSSAVGEIIVMLFEMAGIAMTQEAAVCAYVSIATDTGGFRFRNTTPRTHRIVATLLETGIDVAEISLRIFDLSSRQKVLLLQRVLERLTFLSEGHLSYSYITLADMAETGARNEDLDGIVNYTRNIEGVEVGFLFREIVGATKVSARSNRVFNCARFFAAFGGGGHALAAGATVNLPLDETRREVLDRACQELGDLA